MHIRFCIALPKIQRQFCIGPYSGLTRIINLPAELGGNSKNLPLGTQAAPLGLGDVFLLTCPLSAGRFILDLCSVLQVSTFLSP